MLLTPAPAHAHAVLVGTTPTNGAQLDSVPQQVRLRFSERITVAPGGVVLRDATGATVPTGPATVPVDTPTEVRLPWPAEAGEGTWVVSYRVVSADSHPVAGALVFSVGDATGSTGAAAAVATAASAGLDRDDPTLAVVFAASRWTGYAGLALLAGSLWVFVLCWPGGWTDPRARRVVGYGWGTSLAGAAGSLLLQGPYAAGRSLAAVSDPALLPATLGTDYGRSLGARLVLLLAAGALVRTAPRLAPRTRSAAALLLGVALPATWAGTGHSNTAGPVDLFADTIHVVAMAAWFGGLVLLVACLLPRSAAHPAVEVAATLRRFSLLATAAVATLVTTGGYLAWREVGSMDALAGTGYGRLLAFKLAAIGILLWFGAMSRGIVQRRYRQPPEDAPVSASRSRRRAARTAHQHELHARAQLRQSVRLEVGAAVAVLALASVLVATPPGVVAGTAEAAAAAATAGGPVERQLALPAGGTVELRLDPAWSGENRLDVAVRDAAGDPWDVPEVTVTLALPEQDLGPLPVALTRTGPGAYQATSASVPVAGAWQLRLAVRTSEIDSTTVLADIPVA